MSAPTTPVLSFEHVLRLTDDVAIFEHAEGIEPRRDGGYCLDDAARALIVVTRQPAPPHALRTVAERYLRFVASAQTGDGRCRNRFGLDRAWHDRPGVEDCWGRALWGLGTVVARSTDKRLRATAAERFGYSAPLRSPHRRSMAFAALGAAEVLVTVPDDRGARDLLAAAVLTIGRPDDDPAWRWPEPRLHYANAALAEALLAAGERLGDEQAKDDGLAMLGWLLEVETNGSVLSVTPAGGWGPGEPRPGFDQQPIEVAAIADACARALRMTGDERWEAGLALAVQWFLGENDAGCPMIDEHSGGGFDGLHRDGRNGNQGAESTLAMLSTLQLASRVRR